LLFSLNLLCWFVMNNDHMLVSKNFQFSLQSLLWFYNSRPFISPTIRLLKNLGSHWFIIFDFQQLLLLRKIDPSPRYKNSKPQKKLLSPYYPNLVLIAPLSFLFDLPSFQKLLSKVFTSGRVKSR